MDLIERYFAAEAQSLRTQRHREVSAELRRLLLARIEAREARLRRPLRTDEAVTELVGFSRRLLIESRAVLRRLEDACLGLGAPASDKCEGGSRGHR